MIADGNLIDFRTKDRNLGIGFAILGLRDGLPGDARSKQGALIGGQLGITQAECIIAQQHMQFVAVQRQVELALAVGIEYHRTVISVDGVNFVRIEVGEQTVIFGVIQILEQLVKFIGTGIQRSFNQVFTLDNTPQIEGYSALGVEITVLTGSGIFNVTVNPLIPDFSVNKSQEEQLGILDFNFPGDDADAAIGINGFDVEVAFAFRQIHQG